MGLHMKFLYLLIPLLTLFGCGESEQKTPASNAEKKLVVGFSQVGSESSWRTSFSESVKAEAAKRGIDLKFSDAQQKQENQIKAIRSFIAQGVDAIIVAPVVETGWKPVLTEAKRAGIPVVIVDRNMALEDDSLYLTRVASDFVEEGRKAARWLMEATEGKCDIVELQGTVGATAAIDRMAGFNEVIAEHENARIIRTQTGEFTRSKGKEVMDAFLKNYGDSPRLRVLDFLLSATITKPRMRYMGKASIWKSKLLGKWVSMLGAFPVHRGTADRESLRTCLKVLAQGESLVMFPEGTRQSGPEVQPLFDGTAYVALKAGVPVVPLGIAGTEDAMPAGAKWVRRHKVVLVVGDPIMPPTGAQAGKAPRRAVRELTEQLHRAIQQAFDEATAALY